jgi:opacity protein-like surface antigen
MNSHNSGVRNYGLGASVGFKIIDNMWVAFGYNIRSVKDHDFSAAGYNAKGPYLTLRMKVDQDTFKLNGGGEKTRPITHE